MALEEFKQHLRSLDHSIKTIKKEKMDLILREPEPGIFDYKKMREVSLKKSIPVIISQIQKSSLDLKNEIEGSLLSNVLEEVNELELHYHNKDLMRLSAAIDTIAEYVAELQETGKKTGFITIPEKLPGDIKEELIADIHELEKAFEAGCYRSCVILCGRILETSLHRKYYEVTGQDLLEKAPGIGLGKIIAKLKEKEVAIDPGLTQQIHLINQVRIFSVHTKQEAFYPSQAQAHGTILLTMDVVQKLYGT